MGRLTSGTYIKRRMITCVLYSSRRSGGAAHAVERWRHADDGLTKATPPLVAISSPGTISSPEPIELPALIRLPAPIELPAAISSPVAPSLMCRKSPKSCCYPRQVLAVSRYGSPMLDVATCISQSRCQLVTLHMLSSHLRGER